LMPAVWTRCFGSSKAMGRWNIIYQDNKSAILWGRWA
jgi:hypothetical protein